MPHQGDKPQIKEEKFEFEAALLSDLQPMDEEMKDEQIEFESEDDLESMNDLILENINIPHNK